MITDQNSNIPPEEILALLLGFPDDPDALALARNLKKLNQRNTEAGVFVVLSKLDAGGLLTGED